MGRGNIFLMDVAGPSRGLPFFLFCMIIFVRSFLSHKKHSVFVLIPFPDLEWDQERRKPQIEQLIHQLKQLRSLIIINLISGYSQRALIIKLYLDFSQIFLFLFLFYFSFLLSPFLSQKWFHIFFTFR